MKVRTIDLFCGCGGLGLGFSLARSDLSYSVVLGLDNDAAPLKVYNDNHPTSAALPVGRLCDLTWFSHPAEFLLYYLNHLAHQEHDDRLRDALDGPGIGFTEFLRRIAAIDGRFERAMSELASGSEFARDRSLLDAKTLTTAICQSFFDSVRLSGPSARKGMTPGSVPWRDETSLLPATEQVAVSSRIDPAILEMVNRSLILSWERDVGGLKTASTKQGRGLNASIAPRVESLLRFIESPTGEKIHDLWLEWRTARDAERAQLCASSHAALRSLYEDGHKVALVLGGPPCKGFSRIGRPVATSLSDQGTFSWTCDEFGDERNALFYQYVLVVSALRPDAFVFENVENFTAPLKHANNMDPPALLEEAIGNLSQDSIHFSVFSDLVRAARHSVPQARIRYIMVGLNRGSISRLPQRSPLAIPKQQDLVPLEVALSGLGAPGEFVFGGSAPSVDASYSSSCFDVIDPKAPAAHRTFLDWVRQAAPSGLASIETDAHIYRQLRDDDREMVRRFAPGQRWMDYSLRKSDTLHRLRRALTALVRLEEASDDVDCKGALAEARALLKACDGSLLLRLMAETAQLPAGFENHLLKEAYLNRGSGKHGDWFERLSPSKPCKTIVAHIGKDTYGYFHPFHDRALTMREAARIQTFPDWFRFGRAGVVQGYAMIGNAVPPLLAAQLGVRLGELHRECDLFNANAVGLGPEPGAGACYRKGASRNPTGARV